MRRLAILIVPMLLLAGCAGKMDAKRGLSEEWRLRSLEENFLNFKEGQREQEDKATERDRKVQERLKALEDAVQRMQGNGPAAAQPLASAAVVAPAPALAPAPAAKPAPTPKPVAVPQPEPATAPQPEPAVEGGGQSAEDRPWAEAPAPAADAAQAPASAPSGLSGAALYAKGLAEVRTERPEPAVQGRRLLTEFLDAEPNSALVPNALYWIGESYFVEKNYPQAILSLKDVTRRFPRHHKAAAALLKIGMAYQRLGEKDNAALYLRALVQDHPKSEPAPAARKLLKELGR